MAEVKKDCDCSLSGYSLSCPHVRKHGTHAHHPFNRSDSKADMGDTGIGWKPLKLAYDQASINMGEKYSHPSKANDESDSGLDDEDHVREESDYHKVGSSKISKKTTMMTGNSMMHEHRKLLRKFEPLHINGDSLNTLSIGGYAVDITKAAQKASEVVPLPAVRLPIIFQDDNLNFYHHFFQGLEIILGRDIVCDIVSEDLYYAGSGMRLTSMTEEMLKKGYEKTDTEVTVFTKRVMTSTFEIIESHNKYDKVTSFNVAANLWGFQYIESGMICKEPDLRMWMSMSYSQYKTSWFNAFKSAGVPSFAHHGVQSRYEKPKVKTTLDSINEIMHDLPSEEESYIVKEAKHKMKAPSSKASKKSHRHRRFL
jgi:hypothetical protein